MQYLLLVSYATDRCSLSTKYEAIFHISLILAIFLSNPSIRARVEVMYFTAKLCPHVEINFPHPPETFKNMLCLPSYHRPLQNSVNFHKKIEIPRKQANSVARLKILHSAKNCGPYSMFPLSCAAARPRSS